MNREAWQATVHGGHKESDTTEWLSLHFTQEEWGIKFCGDTGILNILWNNVSCNDDVSVLQTTFFLHAA